MSRVAVVGNAGLDLRLSVPRLPQPGETLIGQAGERAPGGKGLNQAVVAARCGASVRFCAPLGHDVPQAQEVEAHLVREGLAELMLPRLAHPTDFSLLMVLPDGENSIVSTSACSLALGEVDAAPALRDLGEGDVLLLQGNLSLGLTGWLLGEARRQGAVTIFNPAPFWPGAEQHMEACSLVVANRGEAAMLAGAIDRADAAIVTLGGDGCLLVRNGTRRSFAARAIEAIDTTGCGDAFCGVMAALLAKGAQLEEAIPLAQAAAALTATRPGAFAALPTRGELDELLAT